MKTKSNPTVSLQLELVGVVSLTWVGLGWVLTTTVSLQFELVGVVSLTWVGLGFDKNNSG